MTSHEHQTAPPPNHHASHPGFSGLGGLAAALGFLFGRARSAELAIELAALRAGDRLVDVGCGPGSAIGKATSTGIEAVGVDPAAVMLAVARLRWPHRRSVSWRQGRAENVPVDDKWATVVWSLSTVHHWHDIAGGLEEVVRVLGAGGRFVALERRIQDTDAEGVASHGWTTEQAQSFAQHCRDHGLVDVVTNTHDSNGGAIMSVVAHRS